MISPDSGMNIKQHHLVWELLLASIFPQLPNSQWCQVKMDTFAAWLFDPTPKLVTIRKTGDNLNLT